MITKFYKTILSFFLYALILTALTACSGDSDKTPAPNASTGYQPPDPIPAHPVAGSKFASWGDAIKYYQTDEYKKSGGADQIGTAYAHARGYTGKKVNSFYTVAVVGGPVASFNRDIMGRLLPGYDAETDIGHSRGKDAVPVNEAGKCTEDDRDSCGGHVQSTHVAGIIAAKKNDEGIQGIAYSANIRPIDIMNGDSLVDEVELNKAIREGTGYASSYPIVAMNNGWNIPTAETYNTYSYAMASDPSTISVSHRNAWALRATFTVIVFAAGDQGHNSVNGMVQLYDDATLTMKATEDDGEGDTRDKKVAWKTIDSENRNLASSHARLSVYAGKVRSELKGNWLSVIALDSNNVIAPFSNGCGDTKAYCLGAPGVDIISTTLGKYSYGKQSGTAQAAAHVSSAIAVLKSAFPDITQRELVSIILETADDLGKGGVDDVYGRGALNLARAIEPIGYRTICLPSYPADAVRNPDCMMAKAAGITVDNSGITLPTSFGSSLTGFTVGFIDDYKRAYVGSPTRITRENAAFTLGDTIATWESPTLKNIALDSNSKMQFTNYEENSDAKDTLIFTHSLSNHTIAFSYNEEHKTPDLSLTDETQELHFQKIRPIASDLMQLNATHKLGSKLTVKNAITSGEFDTGNRFNEAMANLNYAGENHNLTIGAGTLQEYGQFLGASGTGAYQLSDATQSTVTHLAISQNLPLNSSVKVKYTNFKTFVAMRYNNFANINDLTADEYQLSFGKKQVFGKNDSLNFELIQPFAVTDGKLQQSTVLGYTAEGTRNNVVQNYTLAPTNRRQQIRMTWQNQINLERKTKLFISMQYDKHVDNVRDKEDSQILGGVSTRF